MVLIVDMYDNVEQNFEKAKTMIQELYIEAKRAP